jgi:hypothetical protein
MKRQFQLDQVNPLRGLDQPTLIGMLEQAERGQYARLQWLYRFLEKRGPMVRAVKRRLLASLGALEWDIKIVDTGDDEQKKQLAEKQAETLRQHYDAVVNLADALKFLALSELRGYSHLEKIYAGAGAEDPWRIVELRPVEQWFWCREGRYGRWQYNAEARETITGTPIDPTHFIIREIDDPAHEIFAEFEIKRRINDADWDGFLEDYGVPPMFIVQPPNVPSDREREYQTTAEQAVSRGRGSLPNGASLETPTATGSGGAGVFSERLKYIDEQIVIAATSGKLTVLSEGGSGTLAGGAQKEAFDDIAQAIANEISGEMQRQFDKPLLERLHRGEPVLAYFNYAPVDEEDTGKIIDDAVKLHSAGLEVDADEMSEDIGRKLTRLAAPAPQQNGAGTPLVERTAAPLVESPDKPEGGSQPSTLNSQPADAVAAALRVAPEFVAPARSLINRLLAEAQREDLSDDELLAAAQQMLDQLPELAQTMDVTGVAAALQKSMAEAVEKTLTGAA